jgi:hypothetical protein
MAMKKLLLTGVTVLFLATGAAHAAEKRQVRYLNILPPVEFDKPYTGELEIVRFATSQEIKAVCKGSSEYACTGRLANGARCILFMLLDKQLGDHLRGNAIAFVFRHELGHCNGWPADHKNGRKVFMNMHIAMPTMPSVIKELPAFPPVVCVTPDWKLEPCKNRNAPAVVAEPTNKIQILKVKPVVPE